MDFLQIIDIIEKLEFFYESNLLFKCMVINTISGGAKKHKQAML